MEHGALLTGGRSAERSVSRNFARNCTRYRCEYSGKYAEDGATRNLSAKLKPKIYHEVQNLADKAQRALGRRDVSRADFGRDGSQREDRDVVRLEVKSQPGMTITCLTPEMAARAGLSFGEPVEWLVENASCDR